MSQPPMSQVVILRSSETTGLHCRVTSLIRSLLQGGVTLSYWETLMDICCLEPFAVLFFAIREPESVDCSAV